MPNLPVYLDYAAATPLDPHVLEAMMKVLGPGGTFGNPSAKDHIYGWQAAELVADAREKVAKLVGCSHLNLIFTSGATESNNLAIWGLAFSRQVRESGRRHIISTRIEHKSVLACLQHLQGMGFEVDFLDPDANGEVSAEAVRQRITPQTFLVSVMHANSELGTLNDIHAIASACRERGVYFHSDCAQSAGWVELGLDESDITMASLTPEKIYGPKGVGALYIRRSLGLELEPLIFGGGQELGLRAGTVATHQVVAMGEAFHQMSLQAKGDAERLNGYRRILEEGLGELDFVSFNQGPRRLPTILSVTFRGVDPLMLLPTLRGVAASTGSACTSSNLEPSYVLKAIGLSDRDARSTLRFSMGRFTTEEEIRAALEAIRDTAVKLHGAGDMWQVKKK